MSTDFDFLADLLPDEQVSFADGARDAHSADWGSEQRGSGVRPDAVVWPRSTEDVSRVLAEADDRGIPVTPFAAGTGLEGNAVPVHGGISLDMNRMDTVIETSPEDFLMDVEPGVMGGSIDDAAASFGLFFPPLPSSGEISTIGGMIANDASGMQTVKYGEVADWIRKIEVVLADGSVIHAGSRAAKTSSGYNLKDVIVGSEGTLGVVTRATLELAGRPQQIRGGRAIFQSLDDATDAVFDAVRSGVDVAKIELIDALSAEMANEYLGTDLPDAPMVFLEFHANHGIGEEIEFCRDVFEGHAVDRFEMADEAAMADLWAVRRELAYATAAYDPALRPIHPGDVTVPISEYPGIISYAKDRAQEANVLLPIFGHAGDGNVHYTVMADLDDPAHVERCDALYGEIVERALAVGGTATGEHGIGQGKQQYLEREHGAATVQAMRRVKWALDPNDTLNPGKIFPETAEGGRVRRSTSR